MVTTKYLDLKRFPSPFPLSKNYCILFDFRLAEWVGVGQDQMLGKAAPAEEASHECPFEA